MRLKEVKPNTLMANNAKEIVDEFLNEIDESSYDRTLLASILLYTDFTTVEELNKNRSMKEMDTTTLLYNLN